MCPRETARNAEGGVLTAPPHKDQAGRRVQSFFVFLGGFFSFLTSMEFLKVVCKDRGGPSRIDVPPGWAEVRSEPALIPSVFPSVSVRV